MEESRFDRIMNKLNFRVERISSKIAKDLGKAKPFDTVEVTPKERLLEFSQLSPEDIQFARQQFGDAPIDKYLMQMQNLMRRYENA